MNHQFAKSKVNIVQNLRLSRHALPQLPLPLLGLQLQPINSKAKALLLLAQLLHLEGLEAVQRRGSSARGARLARGGGQRARVRRHGLRQPARLQFRLRH